MAEVRYLVDDVDEAISFYVDLLGFVLEEQYGPAMAILNKGDLNLWIAGPLASASKPMPDGAQPEPGGWNRIVFPVTDIEAMVVKLKNAGVPFKNDILDGPGGRQTLCVDPSGNVVELFEAN